MEIARVRLVVGVQGLSDLRAFAYASCAAHELQLMGVEVLIDCKADGLRDRFADQVLRGAFGFYGDQSVDVALAVGDDRFPRWAPDRGAPSGSLKSKFGAAWAEALGPFCCGAEDPSQEALVGHSWEECGGYSQGEGRPERVKRYCRWCQVETSRAARYPGEATR